MEYDYKNLNEIQNFREYLEVLNQIKQEVLILVAIKSTVGYFFGHKENTALSDLGIKTNLFGRFWSSYVGCIDAGNVLYENLGDESQRKVLNVNNVEVTLLSDISEKKNKASILIDQLEYAPNYRGFNIVIFSWKENKVVDAVCFDTNIESQLCYRAGSLMSIRGEVVRLRREVEILKEQNMLMFEKQRLLIESILKKQNENFMKEFFSQMSLTQGIERNIQKVGLIILKKLDSVCRTNNIPYWLHFGTLLGAIRHSGFIPWDDDIDVGMLRSDIEKLKEILADDNEIVIKDRIFVKKDGMMDHVIRLQLKNEDIPCWVDIFIYDVTNCVPENFDEKCREIKFEMATEVFRLEKVHKEHWEYFDEGIYAEILNKYIEIYKKEFLVMNKNDGKYVIYGLDNFIYNPAYRSNCQFEEIFPTKEMFFENYSFQAPQSGEKYVKKMYGNIYQLPDDIISHKHFTITSKQEQEIEKLIEINN